MIKRVKDAFAKWQEEGNKIIFWEPKPSYNKAIDELISAINDLKPLTWTKEIPIEPGKYILKFHDEIFEAHLREGDNGLKFWYKDSFHIIENNDQYEFLRIYE